MVKNALAFYTRYYQPIPLVLMDMVQEMMSLLLGICRCITYTIMEIRSLKVVSLCNRRQIDNGVSVLMC